MRRGRQQENALDNNEEIDENFWASAAADRAAGDQALDQGPFHLSNSCILLIDRWRRSDTIRNPILP